MHFTKSSLVIFFPLLLYLLICLLPDGAASADTYSNPFDDDDDGQLAPRTADYVVSTDLLGDIPLLDFSVMQTPIATKVLIDSSIPWTITSPCKPSLKAQTI